MSDPSDTFACAACTFEQPNQSIKCAMCDTPNPNASRLAEIYPGITPCPQCSFHNPGTAVRACEICGYDFINKTGLKRIRSVEQGDEDEEESDADEDDAVDDYDGIFSFTTAQNPAAPRRPIEAVEVAMNEKELRAYHQEFTAFLKEQRQQTKTIAEEQLKEKIVQLFRSLQYRHDEPEGQLAFPFCQICFDQNEIVITMRACGHRMICHDDFHQYLCTRIRDGDLLPWIPCPAEVCNVPCDAQNIVEDGRLTHSELLSFVVKYMSKKLSRNENFITCVHCEQGGFLQFGEPKKEEVVCPVCEAKQTIEKGSDGDLDPVFKQMIQSGQLRECPTCRHLTLKEKGLCNVIECAKCGVWWNWRTREQGHCGKDLKQHARMNGTLWEPGELRYQQELERSNPAEFKALLERNGIQYNPNYVRGGWNDN